jgi:preprotein translocase subunit YajC
VTLILIYVVVFGALMIFMTTRGKKKQAAQSQMMQQALAVGAEVRTIGGLVGTVIDITDEYVLIETTPGVRLKFTKQAVAGVVQPEVSETAGYDGGELTPAEEQAVEAEEAEESESETDPEDAKDQQKVG